MNLVGYIGTPVGSLRKSEESQALRTICSMSSPFLCNGLANTLRVHFQGFQVLCQVTVHAVCVIEDLVRLFDLTSGDGFGFDRDSDSRFSGCEHSLVLVDHGEDQGAVRPHRSYVSRLGSAGVISTPRAAAGDQSGVLRKVNGGV